MFGSGRNNDRVAVLEVVFVTVDDRFAVTGFEPEELIIVRMDLDADVFLGLEAHQNELAVSGGVEDLSEIVVLKG